MKRALLLPILFLASNFAIAQSLTIGTGQFRHNVNLYGPMVSLIADSLYNRHAYIYSASLFGDLGNSDTIRSIAFNRSASTTAPLSGNPTLRIWFNKTTMTSYGAAALNWESRMKNAKLVYSGDPTAYIQGTGGYNTIPLDSPFAWSSGTGQNFELLVEYEQIARQGQDIFWLYDRNDRIPAFMNDQTKYVSGTLPNKDSLTTGSNLRHPNIRLDYPKADNVGAEEVSSICFINVGEYNIPTVVVSNTGLNAQNNFSVTASLGMSYSSTKTIANLLPGAFTIVTFDTLPARTAEASEQLLIHTDLGTDAYSNDDTIRQLIEFHDPNKNLRHYSNGPFINNPGGGFMNHDESVVRSPIAFSGNNANHGSGFKLAEDFTVPPGLGPWDAWVIDSIILYTYQTGSDRTSTFTGAYFRILDGRPEDPTTNLIFGDTITNSLFDTYWTSVYKVFQTGDTTRPIMKVVMVPLVANVVSLPPGKYWLEVSLEGALGSGPWMIPLTIDGIIHTGNARHRSTNFSWDVLGGGDSDFGFEYAQGFPFEIYSSLNVNIKELQDGLIVKNFPNPAEDYHIVEIGTSDLEGRPLGDCQLELLDMSGRLIARQEIDNSRSDRHQFRLNTSELAQGQYLVRLRTGDLLKTIRFSKI